MIAKGEVLDPLDERQWRRLARHSMLQGIEAVAVCFLHAYANPAHERRVGEISARGRPDLFVTLSHEIVREYREYERTSTTALNAFVGPRVQALSRPARKSSARRAVRRQDPHHALERRRDVDAAGAGAAGVDDGIRPGRRHDRRGPAWRAPRHRRAIGFDMGGTTAKASLITNGTPAIEERLRDRRRSQRPADAVAGGRHRRGRRRRRLDRLVRRDRRLACRAEERRRRSGPGLLRQGSADPVVTDADLVLGRINAAALPQRRDAARQRRRPSAAMQCKIARTAPARRAAKPRSASADRRRRHVARGARGLGQQGRRSARDRDDRLRRRRAAACGRDRARDLHSHGDRPEGAGHVLGARHADGVVAAGFRAHAVSAARHRSTGTRSSAVFADLAEAGHDQLARDGIAPGRPTSPSSPTCATSARSTRSPFRSRARMLSAATSHRCAPRSIASTTSATARPRPTSGWRSSTSAWS